MLCLKAPTTAVLCFVAVWLGGCRGCGKTPVPFKRGDQDASLDAAVAAAAAPPDEPRTYPDGTQQIRVSDTVIERPASTIRASLVRDVDASGHNDVLLVATDENGQAQLEAALNGASESSTKLRLKPDANGTGCRAVAAQLSPLAVDLGLASVDFLCSGNAPSDPNANAAPTTDEPAALDVTPPEPGSEIAQTHHFVFSLEAAPRVLLHVAASWDAQAESLSSDLAITGTDVDADGHGDVQIALQIPAATPERAITLTWLNRPSGLARERVEPEQTLAELAQSAMRAVDKKPQESLALAGQVLRLHALLCRESAVGRRSARSVVWSIGRGG
jgi:hypothetical protein